MRTTVFRSEAPAILSLSKKFIRLGKKLETLKAESPKSGRQGCAGSPSRGRVRGARRDGPFTRHKSSAGSEWLGRHCSLPSPRGFRQLANLHLGFPIRETRVGALPRPSGTLRSVTAWGGGEDAA